MIMTISLSERQLAIMRVLWERGGATVAEVQKALDEVRPLAYSTVSTLLSRMEGKGAVTHREEGRTFIYEAVVTEEQVSTTVVSHLVDKVFSGNAVELVSHLLDSRDVDADELAQIKKLVTRHQSEARKKKGGSRRGS